MAPLYGMEPGEAGERKSFDIVMQGWNLAGLLFGSTQLDAHSIHFVRDQRHRHLFDTEPLQLFFYNEGGFRGRNADSCMEVSPGDIGIIDLSRDLEIAHAPRSNHLTLIIPRDLLLPRLAANQNPAGLVLKGDSVATQLLSHHLKTLCRLLPDASAEEAPTIANGLLGLLAAHIGASDRGRENGRAAIARATLGALRDYIEARLDSPKLSVAAICQRFGCSRAYLYRLFQPYGGVHHFIQEQRLKRCFQQLSSPLHKEVRVIDIALRNGFTNQSHFSRSFKQRFGISPSEARDIAHSEGEWRKTPQRLTDREKPAFYRWLKEV